MRSFPLLTSALGGLGVVWACGATDVVVGEAPGVARVVAGVLGVTHEITLPDTAAGGPATASPIGLPAGLVGWDDGRFLFADRTRQRVGAVAADGLLSWPIGRGRCGFPGPDGPAADRLCLAEPEGLATAGGVLFVTDRRGHRVYSVDLGTWQVAVLLGTGTAGVAADGASGPTAPTASPSGIAVGPDGAVYVAETGNHRVVRVGLDGRVAAYVGRGQAGDDGDGGPAVDAGLKGPVGLAWAGDTLFVSDAGNNRIRRVTAGTIEAFAGLGAAGFAGDRGPAGPALFDDPGALAVAGTLLFVADRGNHRVRIVRVGPDSIDTFAGTGSPESGPDLLDAGRTGIAGPTGLATAGRAVFLSDSGGYVVRRVIR